MTHTPSIAATALASAAKADAQLVYDVVAEALANTGSSVARSVLLFLSNDFSRQPATLAASLTAATRASRCLQVVGATVPGVFTEKDWLLDRPAAAALVLTGKTSLSPLADFGSTLDPEPIGGYRSPVLSLTSAAGAGGNWIADGRHRFGMVGGEDAPNSRIWNHAQANGRADLHFAGCTGALTLSRGVRPLGPILQLGDDQGYDVTRLDRFPALNTLMRELPLELRNLPRMPLHLLCAGLIHGDPEGALEQERYTLVPLIGWNHDEKSVTLATRVSPGGHLFWALRSPLAAEADLRQKLEQLDTELASPPDFGVMFTCLGRGPYFYDGSDRDLDLVKSRHPGMPLIGAYCARQIAPLYQASGTTQNSVVVGLFAQEDQEPQENPSHV